MVKFGTKIGHFKIQKAQNLSRGFKMVALKQRIFVGHLERAGPKDLAFIASPIGRVEESITALPLPSETVHLTLVV